MHARSIVLALMTAVVGSAQSQSAIQQSHIQANVPSNADFSALLQRDLIKYFKAEGLSIVDRVEVKLLREQPTQSGLSYPKYYAWVQAFSAERQLQEGVARLAAIDKARFDVTNFVTRKQVNDESINVELIFPSALIPRIKELARGT